MADQKTEEKKGKLDLYVIGERIVFDFDQKVDHISFTPEEAMKFADGLILMVRQIGGKKN